MPQGLQIWDASGNLIVDTTSRLARIIDSVTITSSNMSGSVNNARLAEGEGFYFLAGSNDNMPTVSFSGTTMTWTQFATGWVGRLFYGVRG